MTARHIRRVVLTGRELEEIEPLIARHGMEIVADTPDLIISHGGDGSLIGSERDWPGIPKLAIQRSTICKKCPRHQNEAILDTIARGDFDVTEFEKVEAEARGERLVGINEVLIRNTQVISAARFMVWIDGEPLTHEIVGDGLVVATPFGSSGYFRSITNSTFQVGLGLAFNNTTEPIDHIILRSEAEIRTRITRGPAILASDNNPHQIALDRGDEVRIRRHSQTAKIVMVETLTCDHCRRVREAEGEHAHIQMRPDHRGALPNR